MWGIVITWHLSSVNLYILIFFPETTRPIGNKLGRNVHWMILHQLDGGFFLIRNLPQKQETKYIFFSCVSIFQTISMIFFPVDSLHKIYCMVVVFLEQIYPIYEYGVWDKKTKESQKEPKPKNYYFYLLEKFLSDMFQQICLYR